MSGPAKTDRPKASAEPASPAVSPIASQPHSHAPTPHSSAIRHFAKLLFPMIDAGPRAWSFAYAALVNLLVIAACALSAWHIGTYLLIVRQRLFYPYALEWMEGGILEHVARVLAGKPLYVAPSLDFTPFIYTPLYYWVCAPFAWVMGLQLPSLRLVSFLASLGIFVLLFRIVFARTRNVIASFVAVGFFAATFELCIGWFDLARVDSLALCLSLLATWIVVRGNRHDAWAGIFFALAFLGKQSTLGIAAPLLASRLFTQTGFFRRIQGAVVFGAIVLIATWIQNRASAGYYNYYVFSLPAQHAWYRSMLREFWRGDIFSNVPFACVAMLYVLTTRAPWRSQLTLWSAAVGYCAVGWISRLHANGAANVLMPSMAFFAWALGESLHRLGQIARPPPAATLWQRSMRSSGSLFGLALCVAQLSWLLYRPASHVPGPGDREASALLIKYLRTIKGPILVPFDPGLARFAGQSGSAHQQALTDIELGTDPKKRDALNAGIRNAIASRRYAAIVINGDWRRSDLAAGYVLGPTQIGTAGTVEGAPSRATETWIRRREGRP